MLGREFPALATRLGHFETATAPVIQAVNDLVALGPLPCSSRIFFEHAAKKTRFADIHVICFHARIKLNTDDLFESLALALSAINSV